jgi:hypothetical protein
MCWAGYAARLSVPSPSGRLPLKIPPLANLGYRKNSMNVKIAMLVAPSEYGRPDPPVPITRTPVESVP